MCLSDNDDPKWVMPHALGKSGLFGFGNYNRYEILSAKKISHHTIVGTGAVNGRMLAAQAYGS